MGTKNNPGQFDCYAKADPDEPIFVLRANDPQAPALVVIWAMDYKNANYPLTAESQDKVDEAMRCANDMKQWRKEHQ